MKDHFLMLILILLIGCNNPSVQKPAMDPELEKALARVEIENHPEGLNKVDTTTMQDMKLKAKKVKECIVPKDIDIPHDIASLMKLEFPEYRIARNSDFVKAIWCSNLTSNESPYFTTGDFDGDEVDERVIIITTDDRLKSAIVLIDNRNGELKPVIINERSMRADIEPRYSMFINILKTNPPTAFSIMDSDTLYDIKTDIIVMDGMEEKADYYYFYNKGKYEQLLVGC